MKNLTIEQKAKAYDELIKRLKDFQSEYKFKTIEEHFPELKELDDERIREALIKYFSEGREYLSLIPYNKEECVAWLEKQKNIDVLDEEEREFADNVDSYRKEIDAAYQKGYNEGVKITLEKHGEQKPVDKVEPKFNIGDIIFNKKTKEQFAITDRSLVLQYYHDYDHLHEVRFSEQDDWEIIKPKFHKSDWVFIEEVDGHRQGPFQIKEITQYGYTFFDGRSVMPFECESLMTLWTIADAKDGDVLSYNDGHGNDCIELIKSITDKKIEFWFCLTNGNRYEVFDGIIPYTNLVSREGATPATKEQRDTLMKAMADARAKYEEHLPVEERIERFNRQYPDRTVKVPASELFAWHHTLTGSCLMGRRHFCEQHGLDYEHGQYSVEEFISLTRDAYGGEVIRKLEQSRP